MRFLKMDVKHDRWWLAPIADMHVGSNAFDDKMFKDWMKAVAGNGRCVAVTLGDITDCITAADRRFLGGSVADRFKKGTKLDDIIHEQAAYAGGLMAPLLEKPSRLAVLGCGNHEVKLLKQGVDPHKMLARGLGCELNRTRYWKPGHRPLNGGYSFLLQVPNRIKKNGSFKIFVHHGYFAGSRPRVMLRLQEACRRFEADLVVTGHGHTPVDTGPVLRVLSDSRYRAARGVMAAAWKRPFLDDLTWEELRGFAPSVHGPTLVRIDRGRTGYEVSGVFFGDAAFREMEGVS